MRSLILQILHHLVCKAPVSTLYARRLPSTGISELTVCTWHSHSTDACYASLVTNIVSLVPTDEPTLIVQLLVTLIAQQWHAPLHLLTAVQLAVAYVKFPSKVEAEKATKDLHLETIKDGRAMVSLKVLPAENPTDKHAEARR